ncbi:MAG: PAS domain S-box protein, partial [Candidatus Sumerlaeaceae bacterium]|nr:PAS domain S-box protein [Candidatus Sumerlaeaceae bacterium]
TVRHRAELTKAIVELGERLSGATSVREAAGALVHVADQLIGWDACGVSLFDRSKEVTRDVLWIDTIEGIRVEITDPSRTHPITTIGRRVLGGEKLLFVGPLPPATERQRFGATDKESQSLMFVPVWRGDHVVALVTLQSYKPYAYSENDLALLEWLAARLGAAIERAELYERLERSEEQYRQLVETSLDGVFMIDEDHIYFVNSSYASIFGYESPEEIIGKLKPADVISPPDREKVREMLRRRLSGEAKGETILWRAKRKDGSEIMVESRGIATQFRGKLVLLGTLRDVTEREQARERMEALQRIYQRAIEAAGAVPYRLNFTSGTYEFASEAIRDMTGFEPSELTSDVFKMRTKQLVQIFPAPDHETIRESEQLAELLPATETQHRQRLHALLTGEAKTYRAEVRFQRKDGRYIWLLDSAVIEEDERGTPTGALGILQDITQEKRLRRRTEVLAKITADLAAAKTVKEAARSFISHLRELLEFDSCFVRLYDTLTARFINLYAEDTIDGRRVEVDTPTDVSETAQRILKGESVFLLRDNADEVTEPFSTFGNGTRRSLSLMIVPLSHGDRIIGSVGVHSYSRNAFSAEDFEDFRQLCTHCAAGLEHVLTYQRLAESEEQLRALWMNTPVGIRLTDAQGIIWIVNPSSCQLVRRM